jgi:MurNAc alpha-1-phosphate uridylyltransferase
MRCRCSASEPFLAVNGDIWTDFDFAQSARGARGLAHLVLVDNPPQHPRGDFVLRDGASVAPGKDARDGEARLTFAGIGVYRPELLDGWRDVIGAAPGTERDPPRFKLVPLLEAAMARAASGRRHQPRPWTDVGTPGRLQGLDAELTNEATRTD